jgi:hypothetical protein
VKNRTIASVVILAGATLIPTGAQAAGTAYAVDTAETTEPGACKVESWASYSASKDFFGAVNPACGFEFGAQMEWSLQGSRFRSDGEWGTGLAPKLKIKLVPTEIGTFGWAITATTFHDVINRETTGFTFVAPATLRLSDVARINVNVGFLSDIVNNRNYLTYGLGLDLRTSDNVWTLTTELFGLVGSVAEGSVTRPRAQVGVRYRPVDLFSIDVIYGRNIAGENSNWITVGTTVRFSPAR